MTVETRTRACPRCGALNGAEFDRCIRCNAALSPTAASRDALARPIDGRALLGTKLIFALTLLVFTGQVVATLGRGLGFPILSAGAPADAVRYGALVVVSPELLRMEPWRLLSAVFVHFGLLHIGLNLLALGQLSRIVEPAVGTARYLVAYVTSGIAGFATTALYALGTHAELTFTAGASGAIFGIMGVILGVLLSRRDPRWKTFAVQAVIFSLLLGFGANAAHIGIVIDNSAHLGGLVWGIGLGFLYARPRRSRSDLLPNLGALACVIAVIASLVLAQRSPLWREVERETASATPAAPAHDATAALPASAPSRPG